MRILIIDDSKFMRVLLRRELEAAHEVHEAIHGREGIAVLKGSAVPDAILVDLMMPIMNGTEFVKIAREMRFGGPIVVVLATHQPTTEGRLRDLGATAFLSKEDLSVPGAVRALLEQCSGLSHALHPSSMGTRELHSQLHSDVREALAHALGDLVGFPIRVEAPEIGADTAGTSMPDVTARIAVGGIVQDSSANFPLSGAIEYTNPDALPQLVDLQADADLARAMLKAFSEKLRERSARETEITDLNVSCAGESCPGMRLVQSGFTVSGVTESGAIEIRVGAAAWTRLLDLRSEQKAY